jgi:adenylate cyclase
MSDEVEIKLSLPESAQRAFLRHPLLKQAEPLPTRKLVNIYYDTRELTLHDKGIALRTRRQGRHWLQTVKCAGTAAGGLAVRPEWEQPYRGRFEFDDIDDSKVREFLERHRVRSHLEPVFETAFSRRCWRLRPSRGASVLLMLDRGAIVAGDRREALSEIELELEQGDAGALFELARVLAADLPACPELFSKAERGYRLRLAAPLVPRKAARSTLQATMSPAEAFRLIAQDCLAQLQWNALGANAQDAEFVHQMRVALRRLRSGVRTFRPALPEGFEAAVAPPIRALARTLGAARDWDVLAEEIVAPVRQAFAEDARLDALAAAVERLRESARASVRRALADSAYAIFLLDFGARLHRLEAASAAGNLAGFAARRLDRLHKKALALADAARAQAPDALHALRIGVKRLRYATEFFAPLYPAGEVRSTLAALTSLQDALGALNDLSRAGGLLAQCMDDDPALREAVSLLGGWHGPRHAELGRLTLQGIRRLQKMHRFWRE